MWYQALTQGLNEEQRKQLQDIATLADQRRAAHGIFFFSFIPLSTAFERCLCAQEAYNSSLIMSS